MNSFKVALNISTIVLLSLPSVAFSQVSSLKVRLTQSDSTNAISFSPAPSSVHSNPDIRVKQYIHDQDETSIAVSPLDSNLLFIGANTYFGGLGHYVSTDGGLSWNGDNLLPVSIFGSDPSVAFDANGNIYYCHDEQSQNSYLLQIDKST